MRVLGLIGYPLSHSWSKKYFDNKFLNENISDIKYELFPLKNIEDVFKLIFENKSIIGLNITIPYKEKIIPYLNELSDDARKIHAVNTLKIRHEANNEVSIKAYNTDAYGFEESAKDVLSLGLKKALILGTGGAAKAACYVLEKYGAKCTMVSRLRRDSNVILYHEIDTNVFYQYDIIVNATPVGMYPNSGEMPVIPYRFLKSNQVLFDMVYNPEKTLFLKEGEKRGCKIINGLDMLHKQADKAWEIWNSKD